MEFPQNKNAKTIAIIVAALALAAAWLIYTAQESKADAFTGCYAGVGAGYGSANTEATAIIGGAPLASVDGFGSSGFAGNVSVGCDRQIDRLVVGLYADYTWHDQDTTISLTGLGPLATFGIDNQWAIGGRVGYLVMPTTMVYGLVGYTQLNMNDLSVPLIPVSFGIDTLTGYQIGGGIEASLGGNWFVDARYTVSILDGEAAHIIPGFVDVDFEPEVHTGRVGLTYRFNAFQDAGVK